MVDFSDLIYGITEKVPTSFGWRHYINLDNAASTPPFKAVIKKINKEAIWYSSVHRGSGYKSQYSTQKYEEARKVIADFVGADLNQDTVIFTKNTTDSLNKLSHYLPFLPGEIVVYTKMEHHSNELPWLNGESYCIKLKDGQLDIENLRTFLWSNRGKIKLLAVTGASNVTGYTPPIHDLAELAHEVGAKIVVDGAQLIPHRPVKMYPANDPRHLDFLAFSAHKLYAPFGTGVLIGPRELFSKGSPSQLGGGTVKAISSSGVIWSDPPENEEAGSPNILGSLALVAAIEEYNRIGWENLIAHEQALLEYCLAKMQDLPQVIIYNQSPINRVGVISFNIKGLHHRQVADWLAEEGIGVRSGCFCARGYIQQLLNLEPEQIKNFNEQIINKTSNITPGMVRISFGCYNNLLEIDLLIKSLSKIIKKAADCGSHNYDC